MQKPAIGRIVHYRPTRGEVEEAGGNNPINGMWPAVIVAVFNEDRVNLKVLTDAGRDIWSTGKARGINPGEWDWPQTF